MDKCKPFELIRVSETNLALVLVGPLDIPTFEDGCASYFSANPLDIQNPEEWKQTFKAYICYDLINDKHIIISEGHGIEVYSGEVTESYIPFDNGTGKLRLVLGLIKLSDKWANKQDNLFLDYLGKALSKQK